MNPFNLNLKNTQSHQDITEGYEREQRTSILHDDLICDSISGRRTPFPRTMIVFCRRERKKEMNPWNCVIKNGFLVFQHSLLVHSGTHQVTLHEVTYTPSGAKHAEAFNIYYSPGRQTFSDSRLTLICLNSFWAIVALHSTPPASQPPSTRSLSLTARQTGYLQHHPALQALNQMHNTRWLFKFICPDIWDVLASRPPAPAPPDACSLSRKIRNKYLHGAYCCQVAACRVMCFGTATTGGEIGCGAYNKLRFAADVEILHLSLLGRYREKSGILINLNHWGRRSNPLSKNGIEDTHSSGNCWSEFMSTNEPFLWEYSTAKWSV